MSNYLLEWPGMNNIPFVIIDPTSKVLFSKEKPLPSDQLNLDVFENKYIKLSTILDLFSDQVEQDAQWMLQELLEKFKVKKLINATIPSQKSVTTYLPASTLLALIMIWPCCQAFQAVRKSIYNYLDNFSDTVCIECGWTQKECTCDKAKNPSSTCDAMGYGIQKVERGSQTMEIKQRNNLTNIPTNLPSNVNIYPKPPEMPPNLTYFIPQTLIIPPQINFQVVSPQLINQQQQLPMQLKNDAWNGMNPIVNQQTDSIPIALTQNNILPLPSITNSTCSPSISSNANINSNSGQASKPLVTSASTTISISPVNENKSDILSTGVNYIRPLNQNVVNEQNSILNLNKDNNINNSKLVSTNISRLGYHVGSVSSKRKVDLLEMENRYKNLTKNKKTKFDEVKDVNVNNASTNHAKNNILNPKINVAKLSENIKNSTNDADKDIDKESGKKTIKLWKQVADCYDGDDETLNDLSKFNNPPITSTKSNGDINNGRDKIDEENDEEEGTLKIDEGMNGNDNNKTFVVNSGDNKDDEGKINDDSTEKKPKVKKLFAVFEYIPTKEHMFRCTIPKCGQCFDTRKAADLHCKVHGNEQPGSESNDNLSSGSADKKLDPTSSNQATTQTNANITSTNTNITATATIQYHCPKCSFKASVFQWFDLLRHLRSVHEIVISSEPNSCKYCGLKFDSYDQLTSHIDYHYSNRYKCIHCGLLLLTWKQVQRHLENCDNRLKRSASSDNLGCPYCTFVFHKKNIRNLHLLSHSDVGLSCAACQDDVAWNDWKSLRKHYQQKHAKLLLSKITPHRRDLPIKHKPPKCKRCDVEFKSFDLFSNHMYRAHDLVPYTLIECSQCEKQFRTEKSHEWHMKHVHVQEITCEKCSYVTTSKSLLKLHVTQKHSEKQHTCSECDKSFTYFQQLRVHMAHHARKTIFACQDCDMEFTKNSDLRSHQQQEHSEIFEKAPENCPECEFRCFSRQTLNVHIRKNHPDYIESHKDESNDSFVNKTPSLDTTTTTNNNNYSRPPLSPPSVVPVATSQTMESGEVPSKRSSLSLSAALNISSVSKRGRKRKMSTKFDWDNLEGDYNSDDDRKDRRKVDKFQKEQEERLKKSRKSSCARTRNFEEHKADKNVPAYDGGFTFDHEKASVTADNLLALDEAKATSSPSTASINDEVSCGLVSAEALNFYPYLDHSYFKFDTSTIGLDNQLSSSSSTTVIGKTSGLFDKQFKPSNSTHLLSSDGGINQSATTSQLSNFANFSYRTTRRQIALATSSKDANRLANCYSPPDIISSIVPVKPMKTDLPPPSDISCEMTELDVAAESELLKSTGGYCLIQDILLKSTPMKSIIQHGSDLSSNDMMMDENVVDDCGDGSGLDSVDNKVDEDRALTDLNDIDLCEDDLYLFQNEPTIIAAGSSGGGGGGGGGDNQGDDVANNSITILQKLNTVNNNNKNISNRIHNTFTVTSIHSSSHIYNKASTASGVTTSTTSGHEKINAAAATTATTNTNNSKYNSTNPKSFIHSLNAAITDVNNPTQSKRIALPNKAQTGTTSTSATKNLFENLISTHPVNNNSTNSNHLSDDDDDDDDQEELDVYNVNDDDDDSSSSNCPNLDDVDTSGLLSLSGSNNLDNSFEFLNFIDNNKK